MDPFMVGLLDTPHEKIHLCHGQKLDFYRYHPGVIQDSHR